MSTELPSILWAEEDAKHADFARSLLQDNGMKVTPVSDSISLQNALGMDVYSVVVADVSILLQGSMNLMHEVRRTDLDVGVVALYSAGQRGLAEVFLELGALTAIEKPFVADAFIGLMVRAVRLGAMARLRRDMLKEATPDWTRLGDRAALEQVFERASMDLTIAFQPIISWSQRRVIGHEVLLRSRNPHLPDPMSVLAVAEKLQRVDEIGRLVREKVARQVLQAPAISVFVNLHPQELLDEDLYSLGAPLSQFGRRVVFGIAEPMLPAGLFRLEERVAVLRTMGFRFALKNLGAGHVGMGSWIRLCPDFAFLDGPLVRRCARSEHYQEQIRMLSCHLTSLGTQVIAAGIETLMERDAVIASGVDLLQGFAFSAPEPDYCEPFVG